MSGAQGGRDESLLQILLPGGKRRDDLIAAARSSDGALNPAADDCGRLTSQQRHLVLAGSTGPQEQLAVLASDC